MTGPLNPVGPYLLLTRSPSDVERGSGVGEYTGHSEWLPAFNLFHGEFPSEKPKWGSGHQSLVIRRSETPKNSK